MLHALRRLISPRLNPVVNVGFARCNTGVGLPRTTFTRRKRGAGFTIVELLVSLVIITIITAIVNTGRAQYENSLLLTNLSYDIALAIREAQVYGVNVRESGAGSLLFETGYGVHFDTAAPTTFTLFADKSETSGRESLVDHRYVEGEKVREYTIKYNNTIFALCTVLLGGTACNPTTILDITFHRPDPDACFSPDGKAFLTKAKTATPDCVSLTKNIEARITVKAANGNVRCVRVFTTGQIQITPTCS